MNYFAIESNVSDALSAVRACHLVTMLEDCLYKAKHSKLYCSKLLLPPELTSKVAQEASRLSLTEPCGLRGCIIHVKLENENTHIKLGTLVFDSSVIPTFELQLLLKQDSQRWDYFRNVFTRTCFPVMFRSVLKLSPKFLLSKRKLYFSLIATENEDC
ncbi:DNA damage-inducible transcript 4-like protein [Bombina bombina]|uniref:DNA damage-inducible transcript 4-like protein n=1 Tax=Bombina bombina TaxID=8345 RepID=UPI00235AD8EA|nr:DNA damage-inducible transcript 4-like protein [Bombina bombina]